MSTAIEEEEGRASNLVTVSIFTFISAAKKKFRDKIFFSNQVVRIWQKAKKERTT